MLYTILNVEGQWHAVENICPKPCTILLHISKKRLFVRDYIVVFQLTIDTDIKRVK